MKIKTFISTLLITVTSSTVTFGSSILVDLGTPTTATQADVNANYQTNATLSAANPSHTYLLGVLNDGTVSWNTNHNTPAFDNNDPGIVGSMVQISLKSITGTGSIVIDPRTPTGNPNGRGVTAGTFNINVVGADVSAFSLAIDYLNPAGNPLGMSGSGTALFPGTPMMMVENETGAAADVGIGFTDSNGALIQGVDFISTSSNQGVLPTTNAASNGGIAEWDLADGTRAFAHRFDDATNANTAADRADDLHSGICVDFAADSGTFSDGALFVASFDSRILEVDGVPEPTSFSLLGLAGVAALTRRKR